MAEPVLSILIVGYQSKDLVRDCLRGVFEHTRSVSFEVLYLDCSDDGSVAMIAEEFPAVRLIDNDQNLGFGRGNNALARHARGEYLLLLNPDTLVEDDAIGALHAFGVGHPDGGVWGGLTVLPGGEIDPGCVQPEPGLGPLFRQFLGRGGVDASSLLSGQEPWREVGSPSGAFLLIRRSLWETLGGFDESFFMYCEETDLCVRVQRAGHRVYLTSSARVVHLVGAGSAKSPRRMLSLTRGGVHLSRKHFGPMHLAAEVALRWLLSLSRYAAGVIAAPVLGAERARVLRERHRPIVTRPGDWARGWPPREEATP